MLYRHVDGHDYMYAVSEMLESAKEVIFILVRYEPLYLIPILTLVDRTGGSPQSYTFDDRLPIIRSGGWIECSNVKRSRA